MASTLILERGINELIDTAVVGDTFYYVARRDIDGQQLWKTNAPVSNVTRVALPDERTDDADPQQVVTWNGRTYVEANVGTTARAMVQLTPEEESPAEIKTVVGGRDDHAQIMQGPNYLFIASRLNSQPTRHNLFKVDRDGNASPIWLDIDSNHHPYNLPYSDGESLTTIGDRVLFLGYKNDEFGVWSYDHTSPQFELIYKITNRENAGTAFFLATLDGKAYFRHDKRSSELWVTDGTASGTEKLLDWTTEESQYFPVSVDNFVAWNGSTYFHTYSDRHRHKVWKTDGTRLGTTAASEFQTNGDARFVAAEEYLLYVGRDALWRLDSDGRRTRLHRWEDGLPNRLTALTPADHLWYFYVASGDATACQLWRTDATPTGTFPVKTHVGACGDQISASIKTDGSVAYFAMEDRSFSESNYGSLQLWRSDGTPYATSMIYDFGLQGQSASEFVDAGVTPAPAMLYVSAHDPSVGRELWTMSTFRPPGDLNGDLELNATDLDLLHAASFDNSDESTFDLDQSGSISKADIDYWLSVYFDAPLGDVNLDRIVDAMDWNIIASHLGQVATWGAGDLNVDNVIDTGDLEIWYSHRFQRSNIAFETPSVREPLAPLTADATGDVSIAIERLRHTILLRRGNSPAMRNLLG